MAIKFIPFSHRAILDQYRVPRRDFRRVGVRSTIGAKVTKCFHCNGHETLELPFEVSHRIPYKKGYRAGFHPEWLNSQENVVWAHKGACNKACELPVPAVLYNGEDGYLA